MVQNESYLAYQYSELSKTNPYAKCVVPMLDALKWRGEPARLHEAIPHNIDEMTQTDFLNTMANLRYKGTARTVRLKNLENHHLPCLFGSEKNGIYVIVKCIGRELLIFDSAEGVYRKIKVSRRKDDAVFFEHISDSEKNCNGRVNNWFKLIFGRFSPLILITLTITLLITLLNLLTPAFIMFTYDQVLVSESIHTLKMVGYGVSIYIASLFLLNLLRGRVLNQLGTRLGNIVGNQIFRRILYLPLSHTEMATISSQLTRIRDFESVQVFFSGQTFVSIIEIPFVLILVAALFAIAGPVAFIPLGAGVLLIIFGLLIRSSVKRISEEGAKAAVKKQDIILEILTYQEKIKEIGMEERWQQEFRSISAETVITSIRSSKLVSLINVFSKSIVTMSALATIFVAVVRVVGGEMSSGALMASMILVWRVLGPMRSSFSVIVQLEKIRKSIAQLDRLMVMPLEQENAPTIYPQTASDGSIQFQQVSFRYSSEATPALLGINFEVSTNETVVILGHDGAGKTSISKLISGLYHPQTGRVTVNKMNVKQLDPIIMRKSLAIVPEIDSLFYGTIEQNLRLGNPVAEIEEIKSILNQLGIMEEIKKLPGELNHRLTPGNMQRLSNSMKKRLCIARALLRESTIIILDQPEKHMNPSEQRWLQDLLKELSLYKTVVMLTNNSEYLPLADKVLLLNQGRSKFWGTYNEYMKRNNTSLQK